MELENTHSHQMSEALENLRTLADTQELKLATVQQAAQQKCEANWTTYYTCTVITCQYNNTVKQEVEAKEREIQDKTAEVKLLQREKAELDRMRHTDIVKLRLEVRLNSC